MAKIHLDRLKSRYGHTPVEGEVYGELVKEILDTNIQNINNSLYRRSQSKWDSFNKKFTTKETRLVLPPAEDVLPKRAQHVAKAAQQGELIRDTLRDEITKNLRKRLFATDQKYITGTGTKAGRINPKLIQGFEKDVAKTFSSYVKKDPTLGMPKSVHAIAVTEVRSAINNLKGTYTQEMINSNPDLDVRKKWIHNRSMSKEPRPGHVRMDGVTIPFNDNFQVPWFIKVKGQWKKVGTILMSYPHDPDGGADQNINCNCDYDIIVMKRRKL